MTTYLCVAGHGLRKNGTFDPGATGFISKGEHRYFTEDFFPAMKKYANDQFVFFTEHNVLSHNTIKTLSDKYDDVKYIEFHYDAIGTPNAHGGHVIVHKAFNPDALDLRLRDAISDMLGVRYDHKGHKGISGRSDLGNVNRAKYYGINYRLLELGFGTSPRDSKIMTEQVDAYAKRVVEAILNEKTTPSKKPTVTTPVNVKPIAIVAQEVIAGKWGNNPSRRDKLNDAYRKGTIAGNATQVQSEVNRLLSGNGKIAQPSPTITVSDLAQQVIDGEWGNNPTRAKRLTDAGHNAKAVQQEVNRVLKGKQPKRLTNEEVARQIIRGQGNWGNGQTRRQRLEKADYNYRAVQNIINRLL